MRGQSSLRSELSTGLLQAHSRGFWEQSICEGSQLMDNLSRRTMENWVSGREIERNSCIQRPTLFQFLISESMTNGLPTPPSPESCILLKMIPRSQVGTLTPKQVNQSLKISLNVQDHCSLYHLASAFAFTLLQSILWKDNWAKQDSLYYWTFLLKSFFSPIYNVYAETVLASHKVYRKAKVLTQSEPIQFTLRK